MPRSETMRKKMTTRARISPSRPRGERMRRRRGRSVGERTVSSLGGGDGEQAAAPSVGRGMELTRRVGLALDRGAGQGVVVAVGAGPGVAEDPSERRPEGGGDEDPPAEGSRHMVA